MTSSVYKDGVEWFLGFGPDILTATDLDQKMTIISQDFLLAALILWLSQGQELLNNHLAQAPITSNQEGTMGMPDEVILSVGAQYMDTSGYQVSDLEDIEIELHWVDPDLSMDVVYQPGIDTLFSPSDFNDSEIDSRAENPNMIDEEQNKGNCPPLPSTPFSKRPIETPVLMRSHPFTTRIENIPDYV